MKRAALRFDSMESFNSWAVSRTKKQPATRTCPTEEQEQQALIEWAQHSLGQYPELSLLFHVANGEFRHKAIARKLQKLGLRPGVPDLILPVARKGAHSLYIEMKALDGTPSTLQIERALELAAERNIVAFCFGWEHARDVLLWYLSKKLEHCFLCKKHLNPSTVATYRGKTYCRPCRQIAWEQKQVREIPGIPPVFL